MGELPRQSSPDAPWYRRVTARADWLCSRDKVPDHMTVMHEEVCEGGGDMDEHVQRVLAMLRTCGLGEDFDELRVSVAVSYRQEPRHG